MLVVWGFGGGDYAAIAGPKGQRKLPEAALREVFKVVDKDGDGVISLPEFEAFLGGGA